MEIPGAVCDDALHGVANAFPQDAAPSRTAGARGHVWQRHLPRNMISGQAVDLIKFSSKGGQETSVLAGDQVGRISTAT